MVKFIGRVVSQMAAQQTKRTQMKQGLPELACWGLERRGDELIVGGVTASSLIRRFGSPLFVLNEARLAEDIDALKRAFAITPAGSKILYSYKTNCIPGIAKKIHQHGVGAEVISPYELFLAERLSVPGHDVVYNGVSKTEESLRRAIKLNAFSINVDSMQEIYLLRRLAKETGRRVAVGLRLGMTDSSQFGLDLDGGEATAGSRYIAENSDSFSWVVLHFHTVSNAQNPQQHLRCVKRALEFLRQVKSTHGIEVPYLDIGGGFGVPTSMILPKSKYACYRAFGCLPARPNGNGFQQPDSYFREIMAFISEFCASNSLATPKLIIEPGRSVVSRAEILLTRVNSIKAKANGVRYALTDTGKHSTAYPCDYEYHDILAANKINQMPKQLYNIVGRICTKADFVAKNKLLPLLEANDVLAILDAGAYFSSYSSNFAFQRPAIVSVADGECELLRREESFQHLTAMDTLFESDTGNEECHL